MSALRTALRPALRPALGSARRGVSRYLTSFDDVAQSYIELDSDIMIPIGDFRISIDTVFLARRGNLLGSSQADRLEVLTESNSTLRVYAADVLTFINVNIASYIDGELHRLVLDYSGGVFTVFIDENQIEQKTIALSSYRISYIGALFAGFPSIYQGIISNVVIDGGVPILNMPINRYYTPQNNIVLDESGNGNNGTFVNVAAGDSRYYQQRADGNFVDLQGNVLEVAY